ncbi:MAG: caspase family protein, partial [Ktedonobacteraceae bacterium]
MPTSDDSDNTSLENSTMASSDRRIALVVGINNSKASSQLETLRHAEEDAYEVYRALRQDMCGFDTIDPVLTGDKAETGNVRSAILRLIAKKAEQDFLLFYFIGHAQPVKTKDDQSDIYLVTYDFNPDEAIEDPPAHLSLSWLRKMLYQSKEGAGQILIVLDCCYAGNMIEASRPDSAHIRIDVSVNVREIVEQCLGVSPTHYQMGLLRVVLTATGYN